MSYAKVIKKKIEGVKKRTSVLEMKTMSTQILASLRKKDSSCSLAKFLREIYSRSIVELGFSNSTIYPLNIHTHAHFDLRV